MIAPSFFLLAAASPQSTQALSITQSSICSLIAQSVTRLGSDVGEPSGMATEVSAATSIAQERAVGFRQRGLRFTGTWGRCRIDVSPGSFVSTLDSIRISADGRLAVVSGGWVAGELLGSGGECYFRMNAAQWQLIGCAQTWSV